MSRRSAIAAILGAPAAGALARTTLPPGDARPVPERQITRGPRHHWFGYYDKLQFDPTNRFVLSNQVTFEHRTPSPDDTIGIGMIDLDDGDTWIDLGTSTAWCWQQGCMLQWRPGSTHEIVWNDRDGDRFVCRVMDVNTRATRTLPRPIYTLSPDGRWGLSIDFARVQRMRPGYGYVGVDDPHHTVRAPEEDGVWRMDMDSGESELIFSLSEAAATDHEGDPLAHHWSYFNHLLVSPDGARFVVLHRWRRSTGPAHDDGPTGGFTTRMFTAAMDGSDRSIVDPSGHTSHFIWRDPERICAWTRPAGRLPGFYLIEDRTAAVEPVGKGVMNRNGHNTYLPGTDAAWILSDTYPARDTSEQTLYLYHVPSGRRIVLGSFFSPPEYRGEWRCDLHPRASNDGRYVVIDSPHAGEGRQMHLLDVGELIG